MLLQRFLYKRSSYFLNTMAMLYITQNRMNPRMKNPTHKRTNNSIKNIQEEQVEKNQLCYFESFLTSYLRFKRCMRENSPRKARWKIINFAIARDFSPTFWDPRGVMLYTWVSGFHAYNITSLGSQITGKKTVEIAKLLFIKLFTCFGTPS